VEPETDAPEAVRAATARQRQVFALHVAPEVEVLLRVALTLTRHHADAEDLVQDTLVRAFRACDRFDGAHPRAWLLTILRNTHLNRIRTRRPDLLEDAEWDRVHSASWPGTAPQVSPEEVVMQDVFDDLVEQALDDLPDVHADAIRLVDLDGLSYAEAAEVLGVPVGTVMSRLHRGRARIRASLTAAGAAPAPPRAHRRATGSTRTERGRSRLGVEPVGTEARP
jgi:RNA polymerase sigma-70 factor (ECF subfamily)